MGRREGGGRRLLRCRSRWRDRADGLALIALVTTDPVLALVGLFVFRRSRSERVFARRMEEPTRLAQERIGEVARSSTVDRRCSS
jgi:hypothetical protein